MYLKYLFVVSRVRQNFLFFRKFPRHLINFPRLFTISVKKFMISPKFSSLFSKFNQNFLEITLKCLRSHRTFTKFSSENFKIISAKYTRKSNIFSKLSLNLNKILIFAKTLIEIPLNLVKTHRTIFKNFLIT